MSTITRTAADADISEQDCTTFTSVNRYYTNREHTVSISLTEYRCENPDDNFVGVSAHFNDGRAWVRACTINAGTKIALSVGHASLFVGRDEARQMIEELQAALAE